MTAGGWIFMFVSLGIVWGLAAWCWRRVLTSSGTSGNSSEDRRK